MFFPKLRQVNTYLFCLDVECSFKPCKLLLNWTLKRFVLCTQQCTIDLDSVWVFVFMCFPLDCVGAFQVFVFISHPVIQKGEWKKRVKELQNRNELDKGEVSLSIQCCPFKRVAQVHNEHHSLLKAHFTWRNKQDKANSSVLLNPSPVHR